MPKAKTTPPARTPRVPLGVYTNEGRYTAVAIKHTPEGIWYLTMLKGSITLEHSGDERFQHKFPLVLEGYSVLRAIRKYDESGLSRDERTQKVLRRLIDGLSQ